jgi:hypothetical protein
MGPPHARRGTDRVKVSLRTEPGGIDAAAVLAPLGGGGHARAAGCTLRMGMAAAEKRVLAALRAVLRGDGFRGSPGLAAACRRGKTSRPGPPGAPGPLP